MRRAAWSAIPLLLLLPALAREASAQQADPPPFPTAELDYQIAAGLTCPTAEDLRAEIAKEMRYDAFDGGAGIPSGRYHVRVARERRGMLVVRMSFDKPSGKQDFETEFEGKPDTPRTCRHLVTKHVVSEIVMQLTLDMTRLLREPAPPRGAACRAPGTEAKAQPAPCLDSRFSVWPTEWPLPPLEKPKPDPPAPPERWPIAIRLGAAVWPESIASGWGSLGLSVDVGVRYRAFSVGVEAHGDPPLGSVLITDAGPVAFARLSGGVLLCAHWGWFVGCGVADAGRFLFPHHVRALPASTFYGAAGVRAGLEFPVAPPWLFLRAAVDLRAPIRPASYTFKGHSMFASAGPSVGLGLGLVVELPP